MDFGKILGGLLGGSTGGTSGGSGGTGSIVSVVMGMLGGGAGAAGGLGGLGGLLSKLTQGGLGSAANSWVSPGENEAVTGNQLADALGPDTIGHIAEQAGVSHEEAAAGLAEVLPQVVDHLTPQGQVPEDSSIQDMLSKFLGSN